MDIVDSENMESKEGDWKMGVAVVEIGRAHV